MKRLTKILPAIQSPREKIRPLTWLHNRKRAIQPSVEQPLAMASHNARLQSRSLIKRLLALFLFCFLLSGFWFPAPALAATGTCFPATASGLLSGLVGWWKLDDGSGTSAADSSGNGYTGTLNGGVTWINGKVNGAITTDGSTGYVSTPAIGPFYDLSIAFWAKTVVNTANLNPVNISVYIACFMDSSNGGHMSCGSAGTTDVTSTSVISDGNWHHFVFTSSATGPTEHLYVDGVLQASGVVAPYWNSTPQSPSIGQRGGGGSFFNGSIDDVRLYNRVLSAAEAAQIYKNNQPGDMLYSKQWRTVQYCDGGNWVGTGLPQYAAPAVNCDGSTTYLTLGSNLAGIADSKAATGNFWFRRDGGTGAIRDIYDIYSNATMRVEVYFDASNLIHLAGFDSTPTKDLDINGGTAYTVDGLWHHVAFTFDLNQTCTNATSNSPGCQIYVDGVAQTITNTTFTNAALDFSVATTPKNSICGTPAGANKYNGDLADLWIDFGTYTDLRTASNLAQFYNTATNGPVYLGADGSTPNGISPEVFLSDTTTATWPTNKGTGGGFTLNGTLANVGDTSASGNYVSGLVSYWKFDESSGTSAADSAGSSPGTVTPNATGVWVAGHINNAANLNGTTQYVDVANQAPFSFDATNPFTLAAWIYRNSSADVDDEIFSKVDSSLGHGYSLWMMNNGAAHTCGGTSPPCTSNCLAFGVGAACPTASSTPAAPGAWHHVVMTYDGSGTDSGVKMYVDGLAQSVTYTANNFAGVMINAKDFLIGDDCAGPCGDEFGGKIDDARVYNRALSANDVLALYNQTACAGPVGAAGDIKYNGDNHVMQYCDGKNWQPMGPVPGAGGGGCSSPAGSENNIIYNGDHHVMQYCDGANWIAMGGNPVAPGGMVGYWKFDETSGTSAADSSGNGNNGTLTNDGGGLPNWTSGKVGNALSFDGGNLVTWGNVAAMNSLSAITVSAWINTASTSNGGIVTKSDCLGGANGGPFELLVGDISAGKASFVVYPAGGSPASFEDSGDSTTNVSDGNWHLLIGEYDGSKVSIWVDGVLQNSSTFGAVTVSNTTYPLNVNGCNDNASGTQVIDDVRVYNRALSASEVWDLYLGTGGT